MTTSNNHVGSWTWGRALRAGLLCVPALALVACGGGGGSPTSSTVSSTSGGSGGTAVGAVVITTSNAQAVAAEALATSTNTDAAAAGSALVTGVQVSGGSGPNPMLLAKAARSLVAKPGAGPLATGVATTVACSAGGSMTTDATVSGRGATLNAGDSFQFTATNCTERVDATTTLVMNGGMSITIVSGTYDPASIVYPKSTTMRIVSSNFSIRSGNESESFNGDLTMSLTENSATSASVTLSSTSLTSTIGTHTVTLTNYSVQETESSTGSTMAVSGTVQTNNTRLASTAVTYTFTTITPMAVSSSGAVTSGAIKVSGSGSALLLSVTSTDTFSLQVDTNGDGTYDSTSTVTRSQLDAQL